MRKILAIDEELNSTLEEIIEKLKIRLIGGKLYV